MFGKQACAAALMMLALSAVASADGKMFWRETVPPEIPYQRALILYKDGVQTLILQSQYELPEAEEITSLGWVVPVPAVPEVASMPAHEAWKLFLSLGFRSRPHVINRLSLWIFLFLAATALCLLMLALGFVSFVIPQKTIRRHRGRMILYGTAGFIVCFLLGVLMPAFSNVKGLMGVDVIAEHHVGVYDVRVVRSDDAGDLIAWLNANEFRFDDGDRAAFADYIARGWCFVTAQINLSEHDEHEISDEGLAAPLILRFPHDAPVYPLVLTGTGGHDTEILIYLAADRKMTCGGRLPLRYAGPLFESESFLDRLNGTEPAGFFSPDDLSLSFLCKFRDTLTAAQMQEDIVFAPADDDRAYRERIIRW